MQTGFPHASRENRPSQTAEDPEFNRMRVADPPLTWHHPDTQYDCLPPAEFPQGVGGLFL